MKIRHRCGWLLHQHLKKFIGLVNQCVFLEPNSSSLAILIWCCKVRSDGPPILPLSTSNTTSQNNMPPSSMPTKSLKQFLRQQILSYNN